VTIHKVTDKTVWHLPIFTVTAL